MTKYHCIFRRKICALGTGNHSDEQADLLSRGAPGFHWLGKPGGRTVMPLGRERNLMQLGLLMSHQVCGIISLL